MTGDLDDATRPVGAAGRIDPLDPDDEATAVSRRGTAGAGLDDTVRSGSTTSAPPGPRRRPTDPHPVHDVDDGWTEDGSTVVARRESRRRQQRAEPGREPSEQADVEVPAPGVRVAYSPQSTPAPMPVRSPAPVVAPRSAPVARAPQDVVDTAAWEESRRRRSRRVAAVVVVTASALAVGASVALVFLLTVS